MIYRRLGYRDYGAAVIAANSNPFSAALFTGGAADIFRTHISGTNFDAIEEHLCRQFPESKNDIADDVADVASFLHLHSGGDFSGTALGTAPVGSMAAIKGYAREKALLTHATIELNTKCNLRCEHCFHADFTSQGLPFEHIEKLLADLKSSGVLFLCLTGGELFLRRDALAIIEAADQLGFIIELKTNATVLNDEAILALSEKRISDVQVSVYGLSDGHSEFTRSNYSFSTVIRNIRTLISADVPCSVSYQLTPSNVNSMEAAYHALSAVTDNFYFSYYVTPNLGVPSSNFGSRLSYGVLKDRVLPQLRSWGMDSEPIRYRSKDCGYVCWAGHEQIFIGADGNVYPCADLKISLGTLSKQTFGEIAVGRHSALSKLMPKSIPACVNCAYHDHCDSCIGIAQLENGSFFLPSTHKCDLSKLQFEGR